jgi:hypothetical protein
MRHFSFPFFLFSFFLGGGGGLPDPHTIQTKPPIQFTSFSFTHTLALTQVMLQIMNKEEDREKPYNPCKPMRLKKGNKKRMISIWFFESSSVKKKFSKSQATYISALHAFACN